MARSAVARQSSGPDPVVEIGNANLGIQPWSAFFDANEEVAELSWPNSPYVYNRMRNDSQIAALLLAYFLPISGYRWYIDPNGARDQTTEHVAGDFGLPIEGQDPKPQGRSKDRFSHDDHLRHAMLDKVFGFMFTEQVYRYGETDQKLHIRKLAPRMPASINQIQVATDGGLEYIRQWPSGQSWDVMSGRSPSFRDVPPLQGLQSPIIPVDRLVAYVNDKEGGSFYGRSFLRSLFREWTLKDRLLRVDAVKHERNGMGVPIVEAPQGATAAQLAQAAQLTQQYRAGETSGGALPAGFKLRLVGTEGSLPDTLASIRYYDEQMSRRFLAMFSMLGSTQTGSRALGQTFVDFFGLAQQAAAKNYAQVTNEHVIEDLVDLNYSIDENAPLLRFRPESDRGLATSDLVGLIQAGAITVDSELEEWIRAENDLPDKPAGEAPPPGPSQGNSPSTGGGGAGEGPANRIRVSPLAQGGVLTDKSWTFVGEHGYELHNLPQAAATQRKPTKVEQDAKVDYESLKSTFKDALAELVAQWSADIKPYQVEELTSAIAATSADDLTSLVNLQATPRGAALLSDSMQALARSAVDQAMKEVADQGVEIIAPDLTTVDAALSARANALDTLMARSLSEAAATKALAEAGGAISPAEIAVNVADHLNGLSDTYLNDQLGGALMTAQNKARMAVFDQVPFKKTYASELLDQRTCELCAEVDGTEYDSLAAAEVDYPTGGYRDCLGGLRCRGTVVAIAESESDPSVQ